MARMRIFLRIGKKVSLCTAPLFAVAITAQAAPEEAKLPATSEAVPFRVPYPKDASSQPPPFPVDILAKKLPPPPDSTDIPKLDDLRDRLTLLNQFLDLPPDKLCQIRETIAAIEKMSDNDKVALRTAIDQFFNMHPDTQKTVVSHMQHIDPKDRTLLRQYWFSMSPSERTAERQKLMAMTPQERAAYDKELLARLHANPPPPLDASIQTPSEPPPLPPKLPMAPANNSESHKDTETE